MRRLKLAGLAVASLTLAVSLGGCASGRTLFRPDTDSAEEMQRLKSRIVDLQRQVRVNEVELARLRERMHQLEAGGGNSPAGRPAGTDPASRPLSSEPRSSEPKSSEPSPEPIAPPTYVPPPASSITDPPPIEGSAARTVTIEQSDLELPPSAAQQGRGLIRPSSVATEAVVEPTGGNRQVLAPAPQTGSLDTPSAPLSAQGQALYDRGYALHNEGQFVDAEAVFQQFLQAYPNTQLSDNAQYWIGEARLARGDNRGALAAFFETVEKFPQGNKVPDALLKAARCLQATGDRGGSRMTYDELVRRFPDTAAAAVAEEERLALP